MGQMEGSKYQTPVPTQRRGRPYLAAEARVGGLLVHPVLRQQLVLLVRRRLLVLDLVDPGRRDLDVAEVALRACGYMVVMRRWGREAWR